MHHRSSRLLLAAVVLFGTLPRAAVGQTKTIEEIVAWVNNDVVLKSEYEKRRAELRAELADPQRGPGLQGAQLEREFNEQSKFVLQQLIDEALILQQARDMGLTADTDVIKALDKLRQERNLDSLEALYKEIVAQGLTVEEFRQNLRVRFLTQRVYEREVYPKVIVTNEEARKYYDAHIKDFDRPAGVRLREITVITENRGPEEIEKQRKKAEEALAAIKKGDDFAQVASKYSESQTAADGGDLGFIPKDKLAPALESLAEKLDKGQVSDIIPVQGAFMIFKIEDKHNGGILPFELAQKEIFDTLWQQAVPAKVREYLTKLRAEGFVRVAEGYVDAGAPEKADKTVAKE
jgi:peptidyl-prolyl cis-trans isomerase SurA